MGQQVVIMPGGFHPFHAGHMALYNSAKEAFPNADVYVAATDSQTERPFPIEVKRKLAGIAGVKPNRFIQVKSPFRANEITDKYNPEEDQLIFVRSEKDMKEQPIPGGKKKDGSPKYLQPFHRGDLETFDKHAYMAYLPTVEFGPGIKSATEIRKSWPKLSQKRKLTLVLSLYPNLRSSGNHGMKLAQNVIGIFDHIIGTDEITEASYPGNIGIMELVQFFKIASSAEKKELENLIKDHKEKEAWDLIQKVTNTKLSGKDLNESTDYLEEKY